MNAKHPETPATRALRHERIAFAPLVYTYEDHGGTRVAAHALNLSEHAVIKTLVMENEQGKPLIVLMHGDRDVAVKKLASHIGAKTIHPCTPEVAQKHTGYQVGGTSPFGLRKSMPIYLERSILDLPLIYVNGGKRGFLVAIHAHDLMRSLQPETVAVARQPD
ncbi:Cys-tRNA(Pro) deacylase [Nitrogeniibacter mangrovi]|uniref:Cys-tRNA(Pro)/Cys-tRNA(Cys) deacylase n=1 Tax=Nitrogeniibacter mangrovi TaxID=2016596 RepID=A0A6C1B678_9RHOO|nr:Cys-tRNA(Pro) deacylase [Nitrogeniibacter mangrovi]QID18943.1 Cys-tRNA(Pro) deacylase [Nitrogeniibacter mangrovi]